MQTRESGLSYTEKWERGGLRGNTRKMGRLVICHPTHPALAKSESIRPIREGRHRDCPWDGRRYSHSMDHAEDALIENLNAFVAFARQRVGDPELAADLVQDSLLKALKAADKPRDGEGAVRWFYRILRHSIIDVHRRRGVRERAQERLLGELPEQPDSSAERVLCQCFQRLLPGLPEQYREVLQRVDLDGMPGKMAAEALGLTVNNLNVRLHRARLQLRKKLEATCHVCSAHGCLDCSCEGG